MDLGLPMSLTPSTDIHILNYSLLYMEKKLVFIIYPIVGEFIIVNNIQ